MADHKYDLIKLGEQKSGLAAAASASIVRAQADHAERNWSDDDVQHVAQLRDEYLNFRGALLEAVSLMDAAALCVRNHDPLSRADEVREAAEDAVQAMLRCRQLGGSSPWRQVEPPIDEETQICASCEREADFLRDDMCADCLDEYLRGKEADDAYDRMVDEAVLADFESGAL